jgi:hypothetical protein
VFQTLCVVITFVRCVTLAFDDINIYIYMLCLKKVGVVCCKILVFTNYSIL